MIEQEIGFLKIRALDGDWGDSRAFTCGFDYFVSFQISMAYLISIPPLPPLFACEKRLFCTLFINTQFPQLESGIQFKIVPNATSSLTTVMESHLKVTTPILMEFICRI